MADVNLKGSQEVNKENIQDLRHEKEKDIKQEYSDGNITAENEEEKDIKQKCSDVNRTEENEERLLVRRSMIDHLLSNDRIFYNNSSDEELDKHKKHQIIEQLLDRDYGLFLAKFGNYLLKEHLCYFLNRSEEDSLVVDLHIKQLTKVLESKSAKKRVSDPCVERMDLDINLTSEEKAKLELRNQLLDHLSLSKDAHFKSQQVGEPDLEQVEKRDIAEKLLDRSASLFLSRFGTHLLEEHLVYFDDGFSCEEKYEVEYHLKQLRKTHCKTVSQVGIKNRRFEALKKMVEEGSYFCESEMRNRNPLLYEQLVGRFLTPEERKERLDNIDTTNITFVNLLLEQMDRESVKKLRKEQEEAEDDAMEEEDTSDDQMEEEYDDDSEEDNKLDKTFWGEEYTDSNISSIKRAVAKKDVKKFQQKGQEELDCEVSDAEKKLLMDEFRSNMFSSFLQGKDANFDYSQVDYNPDFDDLEAQGQDEEEKYFDEESLQDVISSKMSDDEDVLDRFMEHLKPEPTNQQLTEKMNDLACNNT